MLAGADCRSTAVRAVPTGHWTFVVRTSEYVCVVSAGMVRYGLPGQLNMRAEGISTIIQAIPLSVAAVHDVSRFTAISVLVAAIGAVFLRVTGRVTVRQSLDTQVAVPAAIEKRSRGPLSTGAATHNCMPCVFVICFSTP